MAYNPDAVVDTEPVTTGGEITYGQPGVAVLGWTGGLIRLYSEERGPAIPASWCTTRGVVSSYENQATASDNRAHMVAGSLDVDGATANYGPIMDTASTLPYTRWWPQTDWSYGLVVILYDGTGAGQWNILSGRRVTNANDFFLRYDFATAPDSTTKFWIGNLCWIVFGDVAAPPMADFVKTENGAVVMKVLQDQVRARMEGYQSGQAFEISDPGFPFKSTSTLLADLTQTNIRELGQQSWGTSMQARQLSVSFATIVDRNDFKLLAVAYDATTVGWKH